VPIGTLVYRLPDEPEEIVSDPEVEHGASSMYVDFTKTPDAPEPAAEEEHHKKTLILPSWS
jgi:hypothetical protein